MQVMRRDVPPDLEAFGADRRTDQHVRVVPVDDRCGDTRVAARYKEDGVAGGEGTEVPGERVKVVVSLDQNETSLRPELSRCVSYPDGKFAIREETFVRDDRGLVAVMPEIGHERHAPRRRDTGRRVRQCSWSNDHRDSVTECSLT